MADDSNYSILNTGVVDAAGNHLLLSDNVLFTKFYDASGESWDKTGAGTASWFREIHLPNDGFVSGVSDDRWVINRSSVNSTISVQAGATFLIGDTSGFVYLSSTDRWSLEGDFHIRLGFDPSSYYDEYRSEVSFGLNVSVGSSLYNFRVAKYRTYSDSRAFNGVFYTSSANPRYFGWSPLYLGESGSASYFDIIRVGTTVYGYIGGYQVAHISGSEWAGPAVVSIGAESPQVNRFSMEASYFQVITGTTSPTLTFLSPLRGRTAAFPERALLVLDQQCLSLIDYDRMELWMRWPVGTGLSVSGYGKLAASNGRVFLTTSNGLTVLDFVDDKVYRHRGSQVSTSVFGLALRSVPVVYGAVSSVPALLSDDIRDIEVKRVVGKEVVALATASGVNLVVDKLFGVRCTDGHPPSKAIHLTDRNNLYWSNTNSNNEGDLSYYTNIIPLLTFSGTSFSRTGFFDTTTLPYAVTSTNVGSIHSSCDLGESLAFGSDAGFDVFYQPPYNGRFVESFGIPVSQNPVQDPCFSELIGVGPWVPVNSAAYPAALVSRSSEWSSCGPYSLYLRLGNGLAAPILLDSYSGVSQIIDVTGISKIHYDVRLVGCTTSLVYFGSYVYEVLVAGTVVKVYYDPGYGNTTMKEGEFVDVSGLSGPISLMIRARSVSDNNTSYDDRHALFTNFRVFVSRATSLILGGTEPTVQSVYIVFSDTEKKVIYQTAAGVGSIDLEDGSSDYFTQTSDFIPNTVVNSAEIVSTDVIL